MPLIALDNAIELLSTVHGDVATGPIAQHPSNNPHSGGLSAQIVGQHKTMEKASRSHRFNVCR